MRKALPVFHADDQLHRADTCVPLVAAVAAGEVRLNALVRGAYPGRPLPRGVMPQVSSIGCWDASHDQNWCLGEHRNEGIEITYLEKGHLDFVVDGTLHHLEPGHLTITRPWQPHQVGAPSVRASRLHWLILDVGVRQPHQAWQWPSWLVMVPADVKELTDLMRGNEHPVWPGTAEVARCFGEIGRLIVAATDQNLPSSRLVLLVNDLLMCVLDLLRMENPPRLVSLTTGERSVALVLERVRKEPHLPWTLETMAECAGLARTRFAYHCQRLSNLTPTTFLQQVRVERAKQLLLENSDPISTVAAMCGFMTSEYFASVFRRHAGCSPTVWRSGAGSN